MKKTIAAAAFAAIAGSAVAGGSINIDVTGANSWGFQGDPSNEMMSVFVGASATITNIAWDVVLTTFDVSWADENTMTFNGADAVNVGAGDAFSVTSAPYAGSQASGLVLGADGMLNIEFHEIGFDDIAGGIDSTFEQGSLTISYVPAPSALAVLGLGGLVAGRRRR